MSATKLPPVVDPQVVWVNCLRVIRPAVGEQSFKTWFEPIRPIDLKENTLTIQVPSQFFYEWLEEHYVNIIKRAIVTELGNSAKLEYSIIIDQGNGQQQPFTINIPQHKSVTPSVAPGKVAPVLNPFDRKPISPVDLLESNLAAHYSFNNLVEGECNHFAYQAGLSAAKLPGATAFNPFLVYGGVGLGKTHLAQAIGNEIKKLHPRKFVLYVPCDLFVTQFVDALRNNQVQEFTNYYMQVDALIVDDVQFLGGKEKTQEHFFHIFNHLHQAGKQIIMTTDCAPRDLKGMQERLLSRFKWGVVTDVQMPDYRTRMEIIHFKLRSQGLDIPENVVDFLAQNITTSIRDLQGVLITLAAQASLTHSTIDLPMARAALARIISATQESEVAISLDAVIKVVAGHFNLRPEQVCQNTRKQEVVQARQIAMFICHRYTKHSLKLIAEAFGGKDHSTVSHASKAVTQKMEADQVYKSLVDAVKAKLNIRHK